MFIILTLFLAVPLLQPYSRTWPSSGKRARSQSSAESVPRYLLESSNKIYTLARDIYFLIWGQGFEREASRARAGHLVFF